MIRNRFRVAEMATYQELLDDAIKAMEDVHHNMAQADESESAIVPPEVIRKFVDAHARLLYERRQLKTDVALSAKQLVI